MAIGKGGGIAKHGVARVGKGNDADGCLVRGREVAEVETQAESESIVTNTSEAGRIIDLPLEDGAGLQRRESIGRQGSSVQQTRSRGGGEYAGRIHGDCARGTIAGQTATRIDGEVISDGRCDEELTRAADDNATGTQSGATGRVGGSDYLKHAAVDGHATVKGAKARKRLGIRAGLHEGKTAGTVREVTREAGARRSIPAQGEHRSGRTVISDRQVLRNGDEGTVSQIGDLLAITIQVNHREPHARLGSDDDTCGRRQGVVDAEHQVSPRRRGVRVDGRVSGVGAHAREGQRHRSATRCRVIGNIHIRISAELINRQSATIRPTDRSRKGGRGGIGCSGPCALGKGGSRAIKNNFGRNRPAEVA